MTSSNFTAAEMAIPVHTVMIGPAGQGKSVLLQAAAPTEEQQEQETMRQEAEDRAEDQRLNAVREAFWHNTPEGHHDRELLHDLLVASGIAEEPTAEQIRAFFMTLPADIISAALSWGFCDTGVRERTYAFAQQNRQAVSGAVGQGENQSGQD
ncbi:hypothetical protein B2M27_15645 (plasmid) [Kluyvera intermedia]|uniref:Uncharacterized protein n=1 Tax=Kluyvera intermedia TaxID=61648 RepID=A0ABX3UD59_KLUIN|nr:hypothetical protein [Kluyvera intermedia]ORJ49436.1 hypothetical protein B2M27_15645 [Kluyvera intermedia]